MSYTGAGDVIYCENEICECTGKKNVEYDLQLWLFSSFKANLEKHPAYALLLILTKKYVGSDGSNREICYFNLNKLLSTSVSFPYMHPKRGLTHT